MSGGEAALAAFAAVLREPDAPARVRADIRGFLAERGLSDGDLESMAGVDRERLLAYRDMVRGRLRRAIREWVPELVECLGKRRFLADFDRFMSEEAPRSRYLREVPGEFVVWGAPRWAADDTLPGFVPELARFALLKEDLRVLDAGGEPLTGVPMALDMGMRVEGTARVVHYRHAVHALGEDKIPEARDTWLLLYRDRKTHRVRIRALTQRAASVMHRLMAGMGVQESLTGACEDAGQALDDAFLQDMVLLLADLTEREVLLGAVPAVSY